MWTQRAIRATAILLAVGCIHSARAEGDFQYSINVSGWQDRTGMEFDLGGGQPVTVTGVIWDVTLTAVGSAWLSDGWFALGTPDNLPQVYLIPGINDNFPGTASYGGAAKFADLGLPDVQLPDGNLLLQFLTSGWTIFVEEKSWITVQYNIVPAPGAAAIALLAAGLRRRRR